ncbi:MAG TPA: PIG-L family deacetylase [Chloroflexota bacterium]|nr:PIG-L family deacetylase [Chloroflexota bacterium]
MSADNLTLMAVHAHPDDEVFSTGGVYARAADEGMRTVLVVATGGEEGEILDPARDTPEGHARLAEFRADEVRRSAEVLGIEEIHFLGYRDSGMPDTPANGNPANFLNADRDEAVRRVVRLLREIRPDVLVTYDERGGYGHPDHVTAHAVTTAAVAAAADPDRYPEVGPATWSVPKVYNTATPRSVWTWVGEQMRERGIVPEAEESADEGYDYESYLTPDELITTRVDVTEYVARKLRALRQHETQVSADDWLNSMPDDLIEALLRTESFIRVRSDVPTPGDEADLFAGLRPEAPAARTG